MPYGFPYRSIEELYADCPALPAAGDITALARPVAGDGFTLKNALAVQPMEGCDGTEQGAPTDWTSRRYRRFSQGGAALLWMEAVSVSPECRANPRQLMITEENADAFSRLLDDARSASEKPVTIVAQLTHSGRFSRPEGKMAAIRAQKNPVLDAHQQLPDDYPVVSDEELKRLPQKFAASARLCMRAGFDGVDVKACHLYLMSELLGAKDRPGPYGGPYENCTRLYFECLDAVKSEIGTGILASRVNLYDGAAGDWGVGENLSVAWEEPMRLVREAAQKGVKLFNLTMGTPYYNPHVNRPYARGGYESDEIPARGVARLLEGAKKAKEAAKGCVCVATGFSYLRQFAPNVAAGMIERGEADVAGFGREAFAYPDFAKDILEKGMMDPEKCCVTCGLCTVIMRAGGRPGCPVRDGERYVEELRRVKK